MFQDYLSRHLRYWNLVHRNYDDLVFKLTRQAMCVSSQYVGTRVSNATEALVIVDQLHTVQAPRSLAGPRQTFVEISLTVLSSESWRAGACVSTHAVHTLSSIPTARLPGARLRCTVILVHFTLDSYREKQTDKKFVVSIK